MQPNLALETLVGAKCPVIVLQGDPLALPKLAAVATDPADAERAQRETFVWTLAHELRQPLSVLATAVAILRQDSTSDAAARSVDVMTRQIRQMSRLVEDLVDAARLKTGKVSVELVRLDLRTVLADAAFDVAPEVAERQHTLQVHAGPLPLWVRGDAQRLHQVFSNLLRNAIKYTNTGGRIVVSVEGGTATVTAHVIDSGHGMGAPGLARIFDLFTQIEPASFGLGIGLNVVREIVALHSGIIQAHSAGLGKGSEFVVVLPRVD